MTQRPTAKFNKYKMSLDSSSLDPKLNWISVELVDNTIRAMQLGKAAGVDGIETEHLRYAHPRICVMLSAQR